MNRKTNLLFSIPKLNLSYFINSRLNKMTTVLHSDDPKSIEIASSLLKMGKVIALPTDTVYGLACSANNPTSIQNLYDIKGRDENKPVAICVANYKDLRHWGDATHLSDELLKKLLPGPVTIVLNRTKNLDNPFLNNGCRKIGVRIPDFKFIRDVSRAFCNPIALTSANRSSEKSSLNISEFVKLWPDLGAVFDGGQLGVTEEQRAASTVIDLSESNHCHVIRKGVALDRTLNYLKEFNISL